MRRGGGRGGEGRGGEGRGGEGRGGEGRGGEGRGGEGRALSKERCKQLDAVGCDVHPMLKRFVSTTSHGRSFTYKHDMCEKVSVG